MLGVFIADLTEYQLFPADDVGIGRTLPQALVLLLAIFERSKTSRRVFSQPI
jgi:hypothetical protein